MDRLALFLTVLFALFQSFGVAMYLESLGGYMGWGWRLGVCVSLTAGTCLLVGLARWVSRAGLGNGIAALLVAEHLSLIAERAPKPGTWTTDAPTDYLTLGGAVLATGFATFWAVWRGRASKTSPVGVPASGIAPLALMAAFVSMLDSVPFLGPMPRLQSIFAYNAQKPIGLGYVVGLLLLSCILGWLFHTPSRIATLLHRASPMTNEQETQKSVAKRLAMATLWTGLFLVVLVGAGSLVNPTSMSVLFDASMIAFLVVWALDVRRDWLAFRASEDWVPVWLEHRVYAIDIAVKSLEEHEIPVLARGQHARALFQFYAPHIPMELWVPSAHAEEASELLQRLLCPASEQGKGELVKVFE